jgi:hypothetical protein
MKRGRNFADVAAEWSLFTTQPDYAWHRMSGEEREELKRKFDDMSLAEADQFISDLKHGVVQTKRIVVRKVEEAREVYVRRALEQLDEIDQAILDGILNNIDTVVSNLGDAIIVTIPEHLSVKLIKRILTFRGYTVEVQQDKPRRFRISILPAEALKAEVNAGSIPPKF